MGEDPIDKARRRRREARKPGKPSWTEESRVGRGLLATLAVSGAALALVVYALFKVAKGASDPSAALWAEGLTMGAMLLGPLIALAIVNGPKLLRESRAARARKIEGVAFEGKEVSYESSAGAMWACAAQAAAAMGEDPKTWPMEFLRAGPGALRREGERVWVRRDAWAWRAARDGDLTLRRLVARLEADGFRVLQKALDEARRHGRDQQGIAQRESEAELAAKGAQGEAEASKPGE